MRVEQYASFNIFSDTIPPDEITRLVGIQPDQAKLRGSRLPGPPPIPRTHIWTVRSHLPRWAPSRSKNEPWIPLDAHVEQVVDQLEPVAEQVKMLCATDGTSCVLGLVRYYHEDPTDDANLGFHLDGRTLRFLLDVGAEIDVDEYDWACDPDIGG